MRIFISLSGKEQIIKGSRIAVRQGKDYWLATVTRRSSDGTVSLQYDEGTKDSGVSLRTATHLPDGTKASKKPLTKEQVQVLVEKGKAAAAKLKAAAEKAKLASKTTTKTVVKPPVKATTKAVVKPPAVKAPVAKTEPVAKTRTKTAKVAETPAEKKETLSDLHAQLQQLDRDEMADNKRGRVSEERKAQTSRARALIQAKIKKLTPERQYEDNELADPHKPSNTKITRDEFFNDLVGNTHNLWDSDTFSISTKEGSTKFQIKNYMRPVTSVVQAAKKLSSLGWKELVARPRADGRTSRRVFTNPKTGQYVLVLNSIGNSRRRGAVLKTSGQVFLFDEMPPKEIREKYESTQEVVNQAKEQAKTRRAEKKSYMEERFDWLATFSPEKMHEKPNLGDLSKADPRDIKPEIGKVLHAMGFSKARDLVSERSKFAVHPLSMAVHADFDMGPDRLQKQKDTASETIMHEAEKAGLKAERTKSGFRLTSKLGYVDFDVRHKPFAKGNRGLFTITPV